MKQTENQIKPQVKYANQNRLEYMMCINYAGEII